MTINYISALITILLNSIWAITDQKKKFGQWIRRLAILALIGFIIIEINTFKH